MRTIVHNQLYQIPYHISRAICMLCIVTIRYTTESPHDMRMRVDDPKLYEQGLDATTTIGKAIGYKQSFQFLQDYWLRNTHKTATMHRKGFYRYLLTFQAATRQLCASQMRSFRKDDRFCWLMRDEVTTEDELVEQAMGAIFEGIRSPFDESWDINFTGANIKLLSGHLPELELYDDLNVVDDKMQTLAQRVFEVSERQGWSTRFMEEARPVTPSQDRKATLEKNTVNGDEVKMTKGDRRRERWEKSPRGQEKLRKQRQLTDDKGRPLVTWHQFIES
eukprot:m.207840 g.207840  ORF g.207840 m.207840 type:complete len:277 (+) comp15032_c0_seq3:843-1673(+)